MLKNDVMERKILARPSPDSPIQSLRLHRFRDLKRSSQASGGVKQARVIAVTYLCGRSSPRLPVFSPPMHTGMKLFPFSTPSTSQSPILSQAIWPFCMCVFERRGRPPPWDGLYDCFICVCLHCVCEGAEDGWMLGVSWPSPFLSD